MQWYDGLLGEEIQRIEFLEPSQRKSGHALHLRR